MKAGNAICRGPGDGWQRRTKVAEAADAKAAKLNFEASESLHVVNQNTLLERGCELRTFQDDAD